MKILGKTDIGCNRNENQDTFRSGQMSGIGAFGVVCDGMGGAQNGRLASAVAADCIEEMLYQQMRVKSHKMDFRRMLEDAIRLANSEVYARGGGGEGMMGTTAVCAIISRGVLYYAHVGDSRLYLYENGRLEQITHDHSMVQEMLDMGAITSAEAQRHPERNVITRALGVEKTVDPSFGECGIAAGSIALLCTDGLTNMISAERIGGLIASSDIYDLPRALVSAALAAGGDDNITVLAMQPDAGD